MTLKTTFLTPTHEVTAFFNVQSCHYTLYRQIPVCSVHSVFWRYKKQSLLGKKASGLFKTKQLLLQLDLRLSIRVSLKKNGLSLPFFSPGTRMFLSCHTSSLRLKSLHPRQSNKVLGGSFTHLVHTLSGCVETYKHRFHTFKCLLLIT